MTIALSANTPRVSYTVNQSATQTAFTVNFEFFDDADLNFYVDGTKKTLSTHYTVSGGNGSTGTINTTSGNTVTGASGGSTIVITRDIALARITDFPSSGSFQVATLNTELDRFTAIASDLNDAGARGIRLQDFDSAVSMDLPLLASRKGTVLGFNASTGAVEAGPTITAVQSLSAVTASINLLGTSAVVEDMGLLATSTVIEDMGLLATSGNVTAMGLLGVSGVITDMGILGTTAIVEDMGFLGTSANVTAMGLLGNSTTITAMGKLGNDTTIADMAILGTDAIVADMAILANSTIVDDLAILATSAIVDDMALLATSAVIEDMGLLATSTVIEDMGLLATSAVIEDMGLLGVAAVIEDMGLLGVAGVIEDMGILGTSANVTAMSNVSGSIANVNTVASNLASVNSFGNVYRIASSAPSSSLTSGDLYFNTSTNVLNVYGASGWQNAGSSVNGTSQRYHYDIGSAVTSVTGSDASSNTLAYDAGYVDVYVNGVRMSTADVTVTSGDTVTFASALASGDEVDIVAYGTFAVANLNADNLDSGTVPTARVAGAYTGITSVGTLTGTLTANGGAVFNEGSADVDFRVESNGNANMLFVNGGTDRVGIGTATPLSKLDVTGGFITVSKDANTAGRVGASEYITGSTANDLIVQATGSAITRFYQSGVNSLNIDATGAVTMPLQPAFLVTKNGTQQSNIPINASTTVLFQTERFDQNADFASNTFTAPVTGRYQLSVNLGLLNLDQSTSYITINIKTSNAGYIQIFNPDIFDQDADYFSVSHSVLVDMDASDTAFIEIFMPNDGAAQMDIEGNAQYSYFSGFLAC